MQMTVLIADTEKKQQEFLKQVVNEGKKKKIKEQL